MSRAADTSSAARFGYWAALATGLSTLITFAIAIATPPLSGQLCAAGCYSYPYLDIEARFPRDYLWMFPAIVATLFYLAFTIALYARVAPAGRPFAQLGLALSTMATLTLIGDSFVQLSADRRRVHDRGRVSSRPARRGYAARIQLLAAAD